MATCGGCAERRAALAEGLRAARGGQYAAAAQQAMGAARSLTEDAKAFAKALSTRSVKR